MFRFIVRVHAKWSYVWRKESQSHMNELSARVADAKAKETRQAIAKLTADADGMETRIKQMGELMEKGYWECENGHENAAANFPDLEAGAPSTCLECKRPVRYVSRATMSGQEQYQSDKDRKEAEGLLEAKRAEIAERETEAGQQEATAKYFRGQAQSARALAESLRKVKLS